MTTEGKKSIPKPHEMAFIELSRRIVSGHLNGNAPQEIEQLVSVWQEVAHELYRAQSEDGIDGFWLSYEAMANDHQQMKEWRELVKVAPEQAEEKKPLTYELHPLSYFKNRPKREWGIHKLAYDRGSAAWVGDSGSGKSAFVLNMNLCRVFGIDFLGRKTKPGFLIWVGAESVDDIYPRIAAFMASHNIPEDRAVGRLHIIDEAVPFNNVAEILDFIKSIKTQLAELGVTYKDFQMIFAFDTYARCTPGADENSTQETKLISDTIERVCQAFNAHVDFIHHTNARGTMRGSTVFKAGVDSAWSITKDKEAITIECLKMRGDPEPEPFTAIMRGIILDENSPDDSAPVIFASDASPGAFIPHAQRQMLELLQEHGSLTANRWAEICEKTYGIKERTFYNHRKSLYDQGYVETKGKKEDGKPLPYALTEEGRSIIEQSY